jgi:DNA adenine methylase
LRYPGAKRRLASYVAALLELNDLKPKLFVEPFAGGASVALELLAGGHVERIAIGEKDSWVASFWKVVFFDTEWLVKRIKNIRVTLRQWRRFRRGGFRSDRERAIACLFLNRTSFSGILSSSAGPIGGYQEKSDYRIDCRFTRATLIRRIERIAELRDKVEFVHAGNWQSTLARAAALDYEDRGVFYYVDPPFYAKADRLFLQEVVAYWRNRSAAMRRAAGAATPSGAVFGSRTAGQQRA